MPIKGLLQPSPNTITFDYFDISNGTGYDIYFGLKGDDGEYFTTTQSSIRSEEIASYVDNQNVTTSFVKYFDIDFDIPFNLPRNVKGKVLVMVPMGARATSVAQLMSFYTIAKAVHWDGSTETTLATGQSITTSLTMATAGTAYAARNNFIVMDVATLKHFKKGETLRITIEGYYKSVANETYDLMLGHDPADRDFDNTAPQEPSIPASMILGNEISGGGTITNLGTKLEIHVPFVTDI